MREVWFVLEEVVSWQGRSRCCARRRPKAGRWRWWRLASAKGRRWGRIMGRFGQAVCDARWAGVVSVWAGR
jgi:hypothetical protein